MNPLLFTLHHDITVRIDGRRLPHGLTDPATKGGRSDRACDLTRRVGRAAAVPLGNLSVTQPHDEVVMCPR